MGTAAVNRASAILWRVKHALSRRLGATPPSFSSFSTVPTEEMAQTYQGRTAKIFFENKDNQIHKWIYYLPIYDQLLPVYWNTGKDA